MKFSEKMRLKIILKVTKNQGFTLSLEDTFFEKPQGGGGQSDPPAVSGLIRFEPMPLSCCAFFVFLHLM